MLEKLINLIYNLFFIIAFFLFVLAFIEWLLNLLGWTLSFIPYQPGRLFEFTGIFLLFVIALSLRELRKDLKTS